MGLDPQLGAYKLRLGEAPAGSKSGSIAESGAKYPNIKSPICFACPKKDYTFAKVS
jgi:hypothetical protein